MNEFFFQAGTRLNSPQAQQHYISANYTHAARVLLARGVNVIGQLVAARGEGPERRFSLSCNSDTTLDLLPHRDRAGFLLVGQVNDELAVMGAVLAARGPQLVGLFRLACLAAAACAALAGACAWIGLRGEVGGTKGGR